MRTAAEFQPRAGNSFPTMSTYGCLAAQPHSEVGGSSRTTRRARLNPSVLWLVLVLLALPAALRAQTFRALPALSFTKAYAGANPLPQVISVASTGDPIDFSSSVVSSTGGNWLSLSPSGCCAYTPQGITATVNPDSSLAPGTYNADIVLKSSDGTVTEDVPVSLIIAPASSAFFDNPGGALTFSMQTAGTVPPSQTLEIRNGGVGTLNWTASVSTSDGGKWLTLSTPSGAAPSLLNVAVNPANLPGQGLIAGTFTGQVSLNTAGDRVSVPVTYTVGSGVFEQLNPLFFTKLYQGGDPASQVITVASSGAAIDFSSTVVNSTGGNWLSISPAGCCADTPQAVTVNVNPAITLAPGTYTAEIIVKSSNGAQPVVVPVTLTIASPSATFFDAFPGELTFSLLTKGSAPPLQAVAVRNAGAGSLEWTASDITADGGNWLTLSAQAGTAPSMFQVGIDPSKLPNQGLSAGTFTGQVILQTGTDLVTIPVTVTIGDSVFRQLNPLAFAKIYEGGDPASQVITVASTGAPIDFSSTVVSSTGGNWLSISPSGCCAYTPQATTVTVNPDITLAVGTYTAEIIFKSSSGNESIVVPVTLTIAAPSAVSFDALPGELTFSLLTKGNTPPSQTIPIRNAGAGSLDWTATTSTADGGNWLALSAQGGTAPSNLSVGINLANLPGAGLSAGTFTGQVILQGAGESVTVPITVTVGASVFRQINGLFFTKPYAGANSLPQVITVSSTGAPIDFSSTVANSTGGNWLSISPSGCCAYTPQATTVTVNPDITLAPGTYTAEIIVKSSDGSQSIVVPVTLAIASPTVAFLDNLPGALTFSMQTAGATPVAQPLQIRNGSARGTLTWSASTSTSDGGSWLTLSAPSGAAPSVLNVGVDPTYLPGFGLIPGVFTGQVVLQTSGDTVTVPVTYTVGDSVFVQLNPLSFSRPYQGSNPAGQVIAVTSTGDPIDFSSVAVNGNGGNWLSISPSGCCTYTPQNITVTANPKATLAAGDYTGEIIFRSSGGTEAMLVAVNLTVGGQTPVTATAAPTFTPGSGTYTAPLAVVLADSTPGATIYYTTDGTVPTISSRQYTGPISVSASQTLAAVAMASGYTLSTPSTATYTFVPATVSTSSLAFGNQATGSTSTPRSITFINPGANNLAGFTLSLFGPNASDFNLLSNTCDTTVTAGGSCVVTLTFTPHAVASSSSTLNIAYAGTGSPIAIALTGTGVAATSTLNLTPSFTNPVYGQPLSVTASLSGTPAPSGTLSYQLDTAPAQTATLGSSGSAILNLGVLSSGSHTLAVSYLGGGSYGAASQTLNLTVVPALLTVTATDLSRTYGSANPVLTSIITGFANSDTVAVVSGSANLTTTAAAPSPAGVYPITFASPSLSASNYTFTYVPGSLTVSRAPQTIAFGALGGLVSGSSVTLSATSSSGLPVTYSVSGPATLSGATLTLSGTGTVSITASQAGDSNFTAATPVTQTVLVAAATQTISFTGLPATAIFGSAGPYTLSAIASSGLPVSYSVSGPATLSGTTLVITGAGTVSVTASQAGNSNFSSATPVTQTILVSAPVQTPLVTAALSHEPDDTYRVVVTVTNSTGATIHNAVLTGVFLGSVSGTPTPQFVGDIAPGASATATFSVPSTAGAAGTRLVEKIAASYTGGILGGSYRVTLP